MSTSESVTNYNLIVRISSEYSYFVKIKIFDSLSRIIEEQNTSTSSYNLPKGLYTLRIEINGDVKDEVFLLDSNKEYLIARNDYLGSMGEIVITPPTQFSSALLANNYASSHEYYTYPAIEWSQKETFKLNTEEGIYNSSLFIFLRFPSVDKFTEYKKCYSKSFHYDFEVINEDGIKINQFNTRIGIEINEQYGWVAFNAKMKHGIYYLIYNGEAPRQIPIYVFKDWHTQFFMTLGAVPLFGTTRVFITREKAFDPHESTHKYIDILLDKLQNQDFDLDQNLIELVASAKYESPMLGILCCYIYLLGNATINDGLFKTITKNIQKVILKDNEESPDLRALDILTSKHYETNRFKKGRINGAPMFRVGFETILNASVNNKRLIPQNSINDFISENLFFDSPFTSFKPVTIVKKRNELRSTKISVNKNIEELSNFETKTIDFDNIKLINDLPKPNRYSKSIKELFSPNVITYIQNFKEINQPEIQSSWIKTSISEILTKNANKTMNEISSDLNISGGTVNRIFNDMKVEAKQINLKK